ncbi:MAG: oligosaccharide flippase family protein [Paracoccaceae bacterium]|nr:oligosaccharide flippase family protein [Paracoccaceae bacterium]
MSQPIDMGRVGRGGENAPAGAGRSAALIGGLGGWRKDLVYSVLAQIVQKLPGLVAAVVLARHFDKDLIGQFFFCGVVAALAATLSHLGTDRHLRRSVAQRPEAAADLLGQVLTVRLIVVPALWIVVNLGVALLAPELLILSALTTAYVLVGDMFYSFSATFVGMRWMGLRLAAGAIGPLLIALSAVTALRGFPLPTILALYILANGLMVVAALVAARARLGPIRPTRSGAAVRAILVVSAPFLLTEIVLLAQAKIDVVMLFALRTPAEVAEYEAAYRLLEVTRTLVRPLMMVFVPIAAAMAVSGREAELPGLIARLLLAVILAGAALAAVGVLFAEPILVLVWGAPYAAGAGVFAVLALATIPLFAVMAAVHLASALHRERAVLAVLALTAVANGTMNAVVIPAHGAVGAAWTTLATEAVAAIVLAALLTRWARSPAPRAEARSDG